MGNIDISQEAASKRKPSQKAKVAQGPLLVSNLNWSTEEVQETRARLAAFEEDWDAPGMEAYDTL
jgi:hypothetical protein